MANPTTAADWNAAAAQLTQQALALEAQIPPLNTKRAELEFQLKQAAIKRDQYPYGSPLWLDANVVCLGIGGRIVDVNDQITEILRQDQLLIRQIEEAKAKAAEAEQGTPNTNENTAPANEVPGNNTDPAEVEVQPPPNEEPETVDEFGGLDEAVAAQENALPEPPALSDEEVDEYLNNLQPEEVDPVPIENPEPIDEFEGLDEAVAAQENGLAEPPVLSDEEVDEYLNNAGRPEESAEPQYDGPPPVEEPSPGGTDGDNENNPPTPATENDTGSNASTRGLPGKIARTRAQATAQDKFNYEALADWRVKLKLAPGANYLYKANPPGILTPLAYTDGVVFPYTPAVSVGYSAGYSPTDIVHSNYKFYSYTASHVDNISITCDFTAQDTYEANYVLAVIHFFRSITKMFYGQDSDPVNGVPPPLVYLDGYGEYQFSRHPLVITQFTMNLPQDVDYIRAGTSDISGQGLNSSNQANSAAGRKSSSGIGPGGKPPPPKFGGLEGQPSEFTYIPTKMQIAVSALPMLSRQDVSNNFSLKEYATGNLLRGRLRGNKGGGFW